MTESTQPQVESAPLPKKKLTEGDLVAQLAGKMEGSPEATPKVTTPEAATRTDNNDRDPLGEKLKAAQGESDEAELVEGDEEEPEEDVEEPEEPEESEDDESEEEDGDVEETDDDDDTIDPEDEVVFTTPDGEEVTLRELKRGFLREADYTRKTQELAEQRQAVHAAAQEVQQHNNLVAEHLNMALNVVEPALAELGSVNWDQLAQSDPYEYAEKRALFDQAQARYQHLRQAAAQVMQQETAQREQAKRQYLQAEQEKLKMALPELADPKTGRKLANELREYAMSQGLSEKEASNIMDHRLIVMLNKARKFDEMSKSSVTAARKKISKAPKKSVRSGQPPSKSDVAKSKRAAMRRTVKETGSADALAQLLMGG